VQGLGWLGVGLALVLAVLGLIRVSQTSPGRCKATDYEYGEKCLTHPHALEGSVMMIVAVLLGILVYVTCAILRQLLENARP
jgi:hypothetical protein